MSNQKQSTYHERVLATAIVFAVIIIQTLLVKMAFETNQESALIVICGFILADLLSICTWYLFAD